MRKELKAKICFTCPNCKRQVEEELDPENENLFITTQEDRCGYTYGILILIECKYCRTKLEYAQSI